MAYNKSGWQGQPKDAENVTRPADAALAQKRTRKREGVSAGKTSATHCPFARVRALAKQTLSRALCKGVLKKEGGAKSTALTSKV